LFRFSGYDAKGGFCFYGVALRFSVGKITPVVGCLDFGFSLCVRPRYKDLWPPVMVFLGVGLRIFRICGVYTYTLSGTRGSDLGVLLVFGPPFRG